MTTAKIGWDSEFWLNDGTALVQLDEVYAVSIPNEQVDLVDATHYQSPNKRREFIAGLVDAGEITVEMNFIAGSTTDTKIVAAKAASVARAFKIVVPAATGAWKYEGSAIVTGYERNVPLDDRMTAVMTLKITGAITEATST